MKNAVSYKRERTVLIVPEVALNLVFLSIFCGLAALMSADIDHRSVAVLIITPHFIYFLF